MLIINTIIRKTRHIPINVRGYSILFTLSVLKSRHTDSSFKILVSFVWLDWLISLPLSRLDNQAAGKTILISASEFPGTILLSTVIIPFAFRSTIPVEDPCPKA